MLFGSLGAPSLRTGRHRVFHGPAAVCCGGEPSEPLNTSVQWAGDDLGSDLWTISRPVVEDSKPTQATASPTNGVSRRSKNFTYSCCEREDRVDGQKSWQRWSASLECHPHPAV
jgi:hypothetical protein